MTNRKFYPGQKVWWLNAIDWRVELVIIRCYHNYQCWDIEPTHSGVLVVPEDELFLNKTLACEGGITRSDKVLESLMTELNTMLAIRGKFIEAEKEIRQ